MTDVIVIGGGIVGCSIAFQIAKKNTSLKMKILEKESHVGAHQTSRNSGVIHSGIYYKPGSFKAEFCKNGYQWLLNFCQQNEIPYEICGKIIVATDQAEVSRLEKIHQRGLDNGLKGLKLLSAEEICEYEPQAQGLRALHVPQAGIIQFSEVAKKYLELFQGYEGTTCFNEKVLSIKEIPGGYEIQTDKNSHQTRFVISSAGLFSDRISRLMTQEQDLRILPFRGEYFQLRKERESMVRNLIYPVPNPDFPFLGVHLTRMLGGGVEAGPNAVLAFKREGYHFADFEFDDFRETFLWPGFQKIARRHARQGAYEILRSLFKSLFVRDLQKLVPGLEADDLLPARAGVRAQASDREGLVEDFRILETSRSLHVVNAPSPAATSSLAVGHHVADLFSKKYAHGL